jgi:hypothetical protein
MFRKSYLIFSIGIISLFTGVVYTMVNATNDMISDQTVLIDARYRGEIPDSEFKARSSESEAVYRNSVANALERIESKFVEVAKIVTTLNGLIETLPESDEPTIELVDQKVNITSIGDNEYAVVFNGTPYNLEDLYLNVTDNYTVVMKVVVIEQNNYYRYYPYVRGSNLTEILNISEDYNYTAELEAISRNLTQGIESFRQDTVL